MASLASRIWSSSKSDSMALLDFSLQSHRPISESLNIIISDVHVDSCFLERKFSGKRVENCFIV